MNIKKSHLNTNDKEILDWLENLPIDYWDFKTEDTKEMSHSFHNYPATMIYPISRNIIKKIKSLYEINSLLDPFSGSGTVLVEGMLQKIPKIYGNDLNPLAVFISTIRTTPIAFEKLTLFNSTLKKEIIESFRNFSSVFDLLDNYIKNNKIDIFETNGWGDSAYEILIEFMNEHSIDFDIPNFKNIGYWFKPYVIYSIQLIKNSVGIITDSVIKEFYMLILSETIRLVSNKRNNEFKMYRISKKELPNFNPDVLKIFFSLLDDYTTKMKDFNEALIGYLPNINISLEDSRKLTYVPDNSIDLLITSPPYGDSRTTVAYGEFSRLSLQWIDLTPQNMEPTKIDKILMGGEDYNNGFKNFLNSTTLKTALNLISTLDAKRSGQVFSFYEDLDKCLKTCSYKSKQYTYQFWVVGNRTVKGVYLETDKILVELAEKYRLKHITTFTRNIHNKVMPAKNSPTNKTGKKMNTMLNEFIIVLRKE